MTAAITANFFGVLAAFGAGILSFLSPCVLPLVPGYVSMVSGLSAAELEARPARQPQAVAAGVPGGPGTAVGAGALDTVEGTTAPAGAAGDVGDGAPAPGPPLGPLLGGIGLFIAGFTVVFVALGAAASGLGHLLGTHKQALTTVAGAVVVALGLVLLVGGLPASFWGRLGAGRAGALGRVLGERRFEVRPSALGAWAAPVMGMAFAFAWTPCIGPVLAAVLGLAATRSSLGGGVLLLFAYSLGLGVPFLVTGLAFGRLTALYARARHRLWVVHLVAGGILVAFGALLVAGQLGWLSAQFSDLLNHLGLHRLTSS
ncbi:MAG: cytochrome c biogenesis CcdA family protein [Acidimicrobiales bacterium]